MEQMGCRILDENGAVTIGCEVGHGILGLADDCGHRGLLAFYLQF